MQGPFVLGILGRWGRGKSFFFNLIIDEMIKIQRKPASTFKEHYAGHIYKVHFSAWTFNKGKSSTSSYIAVCQSFVVVLA